MLEFMAAQEIKVILVEDASRLARDLLVQELAYQTLGATSLAQLLHPTAGIFIPECQERISSARCEMPCVVRLCALWLANALP